MSRPWTFPLFAFAAVGVLAYFALAVPVRDGDGMEYWYQVESLARHFSPELREEDELAVNARFPGPTATLADPFADIDIPPYPAKGYETTADGRRYAAHFWAYPLSAVPARWLLGIVGGHPMASLQLTNAVWFLAALFVVLFCWEVPAGKKLAFLALAFAGPTLGDAQVFAERFAWLNGVLTVIPLGYLRFTGAETFTWANAVLAVVALDKQKYARCSLFACLGATQNPPLALLGVVAVVLAAVGRKWKESGRAALAGLIAVVPMAFYYAHFGKPSLIVGAATSTANIPVERSLSMILDLNQGLMGYVPLLPLAALVGLLLGRSAALLAVAVAVAGMALAAQTLGNWNGGGAGLHRYLVWMLPPLAWLAVDGLGHRGRIAFAVGALVLHLPLSGVFPADRLSYLEQRPLARWVLNKMPQLYSPPAEIFVERQLHGEFADPVAELPVGFARPNGAVTKLLVVKGCESRLSRYFVVSPDYLPELLARIAAAETPTYLHPPRGAVTTNPGALTGQYPDRAARAKPRWR